MNKDAFPIPASLRGLRRGYPLLMFLLLLTACRPSIKPSHANTSGEFRQEVKIPDSDISGDPATLPTLQEKGLSPHVVLYGSDGEKYDVFVDMNVDELDKHPSTRVTFYNDEGKAAKTTQFGPNLFNIDGCVISFDISGSGLNLTSINSDQVTEYATTLYSSNGDEEKITCLFEAVEP